MSANGQNLRPEPISKEFHITSSNDSYYPPYYDRYFTNGLEFGFGTALDNGKIFKKIIPAEHRKSVFHLNIGQKIYTSKKIGETNIEDFDRPYAAFLYAKSSLNLFWKRKHSLQSSLTLGIIGPKAGGEKVQTWWHKLINYTKPEGWKYQIGNEPVVNLKIGYVRSWFYFNSFEVLTTTGLEAGTSFNNLFAKTTIRTGKLLTIDCSGLTSSRLQNNSIPESSGRCQQNEWFLFFGFGSTLVLHNSLIEGGLRNPSKNIHTEKAELLFSSVQMGVVFSTPLFTCKMTTHRISPEVIGGQSHRYASIDLAVRF